MNTSTILSIIILCTFNSCSFISKEKKASNKLQIDLGNNISVDLIKVPKGAFNMGTPAHERTKHKDENLHPVTITEDFWLSKYEITQKQWILIMGGGILEQQKKQYKKWRIRGIGDSLPMYLISWEECIQFCEILNKTYKNQIPLGCKFGLPTEAQWEYCCKKFSTNEPLDSIAWYRNNSNNQVHPVGSKKPNLLGIYDLQGNLSEWCSDWYGSYEKNHHEDPVGPISGERKIVRGGSWFGIAYNATSTTRFKDPPKNGYTSIGLRLALQKK